MSGARVASLAEQPHRGVQDQLAGLLTSGVAPAVGPPAAVVGAVCSVIVVTVSRVRPGFPDQFRLVPPSGPLRPQPVRLSSRAAARPFAWLAPYVVTKARAPAGRQSPGQPISTTVTG